MRLASALSGARRTVIPFASIAAEVRVTRASCAVAANRRVSVLPGPGWTSVMTRSSSLAGYTCDCKYPRANWLHMQKDSPPGDVAALFGRLTEESLPGRRGEQAWRALLQAQATLMRQLDTDLREATGLRRADFDVLAQLADAGGELRMTELAARTLLSRSALTRPVASLADERLVH